MNQFVVGMQPLESIHRLNKVLERCRFPVDQVVGGEMYMIDTGTESFPMVAIFVLLEDAVCVGFKIGFTLRELNTFRVGENIVTMRSKERSRHGCELLIVSGSM